MAERIVVPHFQFSVLSRRSVSERRTCTSRRLLWDLSYISTYPSLPFRRLFVGDLSVGEEGPWLPIPF